jgi:hypothetical protein
VQESVGGVHLQRAGVRAREQDGLLGAGGQVAELCTFDRGQFAARLGEHCVEQGGLVDAVHGAPDPVRGFLDRVVTRSWCRPRTAGWAPG